MPVLPPSFAAGDVVSRFPFFILFTLPFARSTQIPAANEAEEEPAQLSTYFYSEVKSWLKRLLDVVLQSEGSHMLGFTQPLNTEICSSEYSQIQMIGNRCVILRPPAIGLSETSSHNMVLIN